MSRPDEPGLTIGPEEDTRGMACGGTTTHVDFCFVRPGDDMRGGDRAARRAVEGQLARGLRVPRDAVRGAAHPDARPDPARRSSRATRASRSSRPTSCRPIPSATRQPDRLRAHPLRHGARRQARRASWSCTARTTTSSSSTTSGSATRAAWTANLHLVHTKLSEMLSFRRTIGAGPGHRRRGVLRAHLGPRGRRGRRRGPRRRPADLRRDAPPVRVLQRRVLQDAARVLRAHLPVAEVPRGPGRAVERAPHRAGVRARHRRVPDQPRHQAPRQDHRGRDRRQRRRGGAHRHRVHRGRGQARDVAPALRRDHRHQRRPDLRPLPGARA